MSALLLDSRRARAAAAALLRPTAAPSALQRLQIYRHNLVENLVNALCDVYPVVARLVGNGFFRTLGRIYLRAHPSRSGNLHDFGADLPGFLRAYDPAAGLPYLPDVATLEWAIHRVYHAAELPALDILRLARVAAADQPALRFELQPCARFVTSRFPVLRIWQANQDGADDAPVSLSEGGVDLLVVQQQLEVEFRLLAPAEGRWLRALAAGATLAEATESALRHAPGFDLTATLARHFGHGLFTGMAPLPPRRAEAT